MARSIGARVSMTVIIVFSVTFQHWYFTGSTRNRPVILWKARNCANDILEREGRAVAAYFGWWNAVVKTLTSKSGIWNSSRHIVINFEQ